ncbi:11185_t:CDS:2 [Dentiscutata erythropus]|uniref:11185_t:CDS:1 n=1 Tax=Dentiscutata erythropus TaxID=1348616 RepID=A0A9N9HBK9_9GLOM|nr:11185_t:CDS:2 [Dentiscutata erythropus]
MATKSLEHISFLARSLYRRLWRAGGASVLYSRPAVKYVQQRIREGFEEYRHEVDQRILNDIFERDSEHAFNDQEKVNDTKIESKVESEGEIQKSEEEIRKSEEVYQKFEEEVHQKSEEEIQEGNLFH